MDDEQRKYFADMMSTMEGVASDARAAASTSRETAAQVRKLDGDIREVKGQVQVLNKAVFGSEPPPAPPVRPMAESIGDHSHDIAMMSGQLIAVHAKVDALTAETSKQTTALGLEPASAVLAFIRNANVKDVVKVLTLIAAIIAAWKGLK